jgi:hypothetical protein
MSAAEVFKRAREYLYINYSRIKYSDPARCHYSRLSEGASDMKLQALPGGTGKHDWRHYGIYEFEFDLTRSMDWFFSDKGKPIQWPQRHFAGIDYRLGNPYGDIRFNWELNRLQFLPAMAASDADLAQGILFDWLENNPFLHGPGYLSSMEVALRWISIYWAACLLGDALNNSLRKAITGLAIASGNYIERRLSTHSSAGNHLIVEAVGLFWLGKALEKHSRGLGWITKARQILGEQVVRQINSDGSNQEQSFWYLGFVVDALLHYLLMEDRDQLASDIWLRTEKAFEFIYEMTLPDGTFPDYGDRDDGHVFRINNGYKESPFPGLLNIGAHFFNRPDWFRNSAIAKERLRFWQKNQTGDQAESLQIQPQETFNSPKLKTYPEGGMTLMQWGKGRLLFRHAPLGLANTCGHGHADALSIIFYWNSTPVFIDLGSGQYNGDQTVRSYFRSTIAHNTIEVGRKSQANEIGPFMWDKPYETQLEGYGISPLMFVKANHNGYLKNFSVIHTRKIEWIHPHEFNIYDSFSESHRLPIRGALHLGICRSVKKEDNILIVDFSNFSISIIFPSNFLVDLYYGSNSPFMGWRSSVYGKWEPIHSIVFSTILKKDNRYNIHFEISEKKNSYSSVKPFSHDGI